ncbi:hypothetical protein [Sulfurospirillum arsenophilum]|uniref:hypothetical protein n=1 Tax=Sulfurospirillum arsenophilum TaxID=56698 RepID=UPI0005A61A45|nr:hypothetical protein [Sulfurospirillum arsenophilum]
MKNLLPILCLFSSLSYADYLFVSQNACVKDFYFKTGYLYYTFSHTGVQQQSSSLSLGDDFIDGYEYNATSSICKKIPTNNTLGMKNEDFNYLNALVSILVSVLMLWSLVW